MGVRRVERGVGECGVGDGGADEGWADEGGADGGGAGDRTGCESGPFWLVAPLSLNGRYGSTAGKTTYHSRATAAATSSTEPVSLPGSPKGSLRQIHPYTSGRR